MTLFTWIVIIGVIIVLLIVFKNNKYVKPVAELVEGTAVALLSLVAGGVIGFFVGYMIYGKFLGERIPISDIFSDNSIIGNMMLGSIRQSILVSTIIGALLCVLIVIIAQPKTNKQKEKGTQPLLLSDELIKLNELREKGIITNEEFEKQKQKLLK